MSDTGHDSKRMNCVACAVVTVSDTRTSKTDQCGPLISELLAAGGHKVAQARIVPDDIEQIRACVEDFVARGFDAVIVSGGTGFAPRDVTFEAVGPLLEKTLDGFAELFRMLSFEEIGPTAMLSRACAGSRGKTLIFSLPGSPKGVELAMGRLILPVLPHAVALLRT